MVNLGNVEVELELEIDTVQIQQAVETVEGHLGGLRKVASALGQQLTEAFSLSRVISFMKEAVSASGGLSGQLAALRMNFGKLKAAIGRAVEPLGSVLLPVVNRAVIALAGLARDLGSIMGSFLGSAAGGDALAESTQNAADAQKRLEENTKAAGKAAKRSLAGFDQLERLSGNTVSTSSAQSTVSGTGGVGGIAENTVSPGLQAMLNGIRTMAAQITSVFAPSIAAWSAAFATLGPVVEAAAGRISTAWRSLWENSLAPFAAYLIGEWIPSVVNTFSQTFAPVFAQVMPVLVHGAAEAFERFSQIAGAVMVGVQQAFEGAKIVFQDMCTVFTEQWNRHGTALLEGFQSFGSGAAESFQGLYTGTVEPVASSIGKLLGWLWDGHLKPLWDKLSGAVLSIGSSLLSLWNTVLQPVVNWLVQMLAPVVQSVANGIMGTMGTVLALAGDVIGGWIQMLEGLVSFVAGVFTGDWSRAWAGVAKVFEGLFNGIAGIMKGVFNGLLTGFNFLIGVIYSAIAGFVNSLGGVVDTIGNLVGQDWGFSMSTTPPQIPYLAQGAVLPANKPFMAVVGDQRHGTNIEAPLATIQEAVRVEVSELVGAVLTGFEALLAENRQLRRTVEAIEVGDTVIGQAAARYSHRQSVVKGGAL